MHRPFQTVSFSFPSPYWPPFLCTTFLFFFTSLIHTTAALPRPQCRPHVLPLPRPSLHASRPSARRLPSPSLRNDSQMSPASWEMTPSPSPRWLVFYFLQTVTRALRQLAGLRAWRTNDAARGTVTKLDNYLVTTHATLLTVTWYSQSVSLGAWWMSDADKELVVIKLDSCCNSLFVHCNSLFVHATSRCEWREQPRMN